MLNFRMRLIEWLLGSDDYVLVIHNDEGNGKHNGAIMTKGGEDEHLTKIIASGLENKKEMRDCFLNGVKEYLSRYELASRDFAREIYPSK